MATLAFLDLIVFFFNLCVVAILGFIVMLFLSILVPMDSSKRVEDIVWGCFVVTVFVLAFLLTF